MYVEKAPKEETFYTATWSGQLHEDETIIDDEWSIEGDDAELELGTAAPHAPQRSGPLVTVWCLGGTDGSDYRVVNDVTTSLGRKLRGVFVVQVRA